jgi:DnaJ-class molecular chaperone
MNSDLYSILEISKDASEQDIKKAYRKLTLQYHPDRNSSSDADEKIRKINEAYEVLGDKEKRMLYDSGANQSGFPFGAFHFSQNQGVDIFNMFFNGGIPQQPSFYMFRNGVPQPIKPSPILQTLSLTLEQSFKGCSVEIKIDRNVSVGTSVSYETETFNVSIPAGIDQEQFIMQEKGNVCENSKGDVVITIHIENNPPFSRRGLDLIYSKTLTLKESLCGFSFVINHPTGESIVIEEKTITKPSSKKVLPEMGMRKDGQQFGNLIIEFSIEFPESLTSKQIELLSTIL